MTGEDVRGLCQQVQLVLPLGRVKIIRDEGGCRATGGEWRNVTAAWCVSVQEASDVIMTNLAALINSRRQGAAQSIVSLLEKTAKQEGVAPSIIVLKGWWLHETIVMNPTELPANMSAHFVNLGGSAMVPCKDVAAVVFVDVTFSFASAEVTSDVVARPVAS